MSKIKFIFIVLLGMAFIVSCGGQRSAEENGDQNNGSSSGLTEFQMEHGIGPVTEPVKLDQEIDKEMVETGEQVFETKCRACHKMDDRYVGPPLGDVLEKRTPTYIMNMILNPVEMTKKHPEAKKMLGQYMNQMTFQNVSREEARAIVEYLRTEKGENETN